MNRNHALIFLIGGIAAVVIAGFWYVARSEWQQTSGKVVHVDEDYSLLRAQRCKEEKKSCNGYRCDIAIRYLEHETLHKDEDGRCTGWRVGQTVDIYYDPNDPDSSTTDWPWLAPVIIGVLGVVATVAGVTQFVG